MTRDAKKEVNDFTALDKQQSEILSKICASFKILASHASQNPIRFQRFLDQYNEFYNNNKPTSDSDTEVVSGLFIVIYVQ